MMHRVKLFQKSTLQLTGFKPSRNYIGRHRATSEHLMPVPVSPAPSPVPPVPPVLPGAPFELPVYVSEAPTERLILDLRPPLLNAPVAPSEPSAVPAPTLPLINDDSPEINPSDTGELVLIGASA